MNNSIDEAGNPVGPKRVWQKTANVPGLAMSRSFGDRAASEVGVVCIPEITEWELGPDDRVVVVASDGLWEFLSNEQVLQIVVPFYDSGNAIAACEALLARASIEWGRQEEIVDDITATVIFLRKS